MATLAVPPRGSPRIPWAVCAGLALAVAGLTGFVLHATGVVSAELHGLFDNWVYNGLLVLAAVGLAEATGRALGIERAELEDLKLAGELLDVGKLAIPDELLMKAAPLDEDEWAFVRKHTMIGQRILMASPALVGIGGIVRSTHERWDGAGYPDGLSGKDIPLAARIVHACDAYVAMTDCRPYNEGVSPELAARELRRCAGAQFDPAVVEAICAAALELDETAVA